MHLPRIPPISGPTKGIQKKRYVLGISIDPLKNRFKLYTVNSMSSYLNASDPNIIAAIHRGLKSRAGLIAPPALDP